MSSKPNILFLMTDEQRFDAVGYRNPQVHTPNLDALCRESIDFSHAYTSNPSCIPARAAIFTGRYPSQCGAPCYITPLPKKEVTFMSLLRDGGYHTAVIGKQHFWRYEGDKGYNYMDIVDEHFPPKVISKEVDEKEFGLPQNLTVSDRVSSYVAFLADSGFTSGDQLYRQMDDKGIYQWIEDEKYHVDSHIGNQGLMWLEEGRPKDKPWFLTLSFPGPHMPFDGIGLPDAGEYDEAQLAIPDTTIADLFEKPPHYLDIAMKFGKLDIAGNTSPDGLTPGQIRKMKLAYYANMTLIDRKIGQFLTKLKELGEYDNTLILYTSDHGDYMGDFGIATKAQYCSEALMRIPFLMKPPLKAFQGVKEDSFVSSVEIAATCLSAAGIAVPANISQRSLTEFYESHDPKRLSEIYMEARDIRAIRDHRYKLIYYAERAYGEFYDLKTDPNEKHNLWSVPQLQDEKSRLMGRLLDKLISLGENGAVPWNVGAPEI